MSKNVNIAVSISGIMIALAGLGLTVWAVVTLSVNASLAYFLPSDILLGIGVFIAMAGIGLDRLRERREDRYPNSKNP